MAPPFVLREDKPLRKRSDGMHKVVAGLTGGIGCGKSTVSAMFAELGAVIVDADAIVHELQQPGTETFDEIVEAFGPQIVNALGSLDRAALSKRVFSDQLARKRLERITHPRVVTEIQRQVAEATSELVIVEIPLLFESSSGSRELVGPVIVVACSAQTQLDRLLVKGMPDPQGRIDAQMPMAEKIAQADFVIDNDGSLDELRKHVHKVWEAL